MTKEKAEALIYVLDLCVTIYLLKLAIVISAKP